MSQVLDREVLDKGYAVPDVLVSTQWVADRLNDTDIRIIESNEDPLLYPSGHIPGAVNIPLPQLRSRSGSMIPRGPVAAYCGSGYRASLAASILLQEGFQEVYNIPGSFNAWKSSQYPVETEAETVAAPQL